MRHGFEGVKELDLARKFNVLWPNNFALFISCINVISESNVWLVS